MTKKNVRETALELLIRIEKEGGFSHLLISDAMNKSLLDEKDEGLLTEIVYGTMERKLTLDYYLNPFIAKQKKLQLWVVILLRMSVYQMHFLEKVPSYAVINEAVNIAKKKGHKGIASLVNGVLRNIKRQGVRSVDEIEDEFERLSIETSHPMWLIERWTAAYGYEVTKEICATNMKRKKLSLRVNRLKTTREEVIELLAEAGITATLSEVTKYGVIIQEGNVFKTDLVREGLVTVQDESSMLAAEALQVEQDMTVLDTCSAPGGKATFLAEAMGNTGTVYAYDLHRNKLKVISDNTKRLGLTNVIVEAEDARKLPEIHERGRFNRILVDAPCSGFGVIRSKPDIKYNKQLSDIEKLQTVQVDILSNASDLLRESGKLVYSTCTIEQLENEDVIKLFLGDNPDFEVDKVFLEKMTNRFGSVGLVTAYGLQLFPQSIDSDGFFITRIVMK